MQKETGTILVRSDDGLGQYFGVVNPQDPARVAFDWLPDQAYALRFAIPADAINFVLAMRRLAEHLPHGQTVPGLRSGDELPHARHWVLPDLPHRGMRSFCVRVHGETAGSGYKDYMVPATTEHDARLLAFVLDGGTIPEAGVLDLDAVELAYMHTELRRSPTAITDTEEPT